MTPSASQSALVLELAEEFLRRYRQGERPSLKEYIDPHAELAEEIRAVFPAMAMMENIALADESLAGPPVPAPAVPVLQQLGDYRIIREVGRGGMGIVYEAEQVSLGRHVALKVLPHKALMDERRKQRFEREAKAAAKLHHTNIVPVFGVGEHDGVPYYVMQFIQGLGLNTVIEELQRQQKPGPEAPAGEQPPTCLDVQAANAARSLLSGQVTMEDFTPGQRSRPDSHAGPMPLLLPSSSESSKKARKLTYWHSVATIGAQVASALEYAHQQGILHRDIKPSNLLLDTHGTVWIADFGLAKIDDQENLTQTGDLLGTLRYMPPEAFEGHADPRSDVYALGLTLYEMLALERAFGAKDRNQLIKQVTTTEPERLERVTPAMPRDLATIVHKAIDRDPGHRYGSAAALAADLQRFVNDEPIQARRISLLERASRWCRRNPLVATLLAAVVLVTAAGFAATLRQTQVAVDHADAAEKYAETVVQQSAVVQKQRDEIGRQRDKIQDAFGKLSAMQGELKATLYDADMNLIAPAWEAGNVSRMRDLLAVHVPGPGEPELRGFEWYFWQKRSHGELRALKIAPALTDTATFSRDGTRLVDAVVLADKEDQTWIKVWDTATGREVCCRSLGGRLQLPNLGKMPPRLLAFNRDGTRLAVVLSKNGSRRLKVLDLRGGQDLLDVDIGSSPLLSTSGLALSPAGDRVAVSIGQDMAGKEGNGFRVMACQFESGKATREVILSFCALIAAFSDDGGRLAAFGPVRRKGVYPLAVFDTKTGATVASFSTRITSSDALAFRADGKVLAISGSAMEINFFGEAEVQLLDVDGGKELRALKLPALRGLQAILDPSGARMATLGFSLAPDPNVDMWDLATGEKRRALRGHVAKVVALAFSSDGQQLWTADRSGTVMSWDAMACDDPFQGQFAGTVGAKMVVDREATRLAFTPERVTGTNPDAGVIRVLDFSGCNLARLRGHTQPIQHFSFSPDGEWIASVGRAIRQSKTELSQTELLVWKVSTGKIRFSHQVPPFPGTSASALPVDCAFSPDGKRLAMMQPHGDPAQARSVVKVWDAATGREVLTTAEAPGAVTHVLYSPDGKRLVGSGPEAGLTAWNALTGEIQWREAGAPKTRLQARFSSDGKRLLVWKLLSDGRSGRAVVEVMLRDAGGGNAVVLFAADQPSRSNLSVAFSPDGKYLATALNDLASEEQANHNTVKIWDADTGKERLTLRGSRGFVWDLAFTADSRRLITLAGSNYEAEVTLWNLATAQEVLKLAGVPGRVTLSSDGRRLALWGNPVGKGPPAMLFDASPMPAQ
jgi:eukaryotic-like serine/threonine-protein kinase